MILVNAFSLNMLAGYSSLLWFKELDVKTARVYAKSGIESAVGHESTAAVFSDMLGVNVPMNRMTISLNKGDRLLVGQYIGPRLAEGVTVLPDGATIKWFLVEVIEMAFRSS